MGAQHVVAMFGSTVLAPLLMGFDPNVAILMSGIGTLIFFLFVGGRVPSYLGSSFAFIGGVIAVTGYGAAAPRQYRRGAGRHHRLRPGLYPDRPDRLGRQCARGGGAGWIDADAAGGDRRRGGRDRPEPAPIAAKGAMGQSGFDTAMALVTVLCVGGIAVYTRGMVQRLLILVGLILACVVYVICANVLGLGKPVDFAGVTAAAWFGLPHFAAPVFKAEAMGLIVPVAIILVAENLGHVKAVSAMTGQDLDRYLGRAFVGDGVATMVSGAVGGTGVTTYAENIGVMAVTRIYSTLVFVVAALIAIVLGFSPKFGALIQTIRRPCWAACRRGVWPDRRGRRPYLGGEPGRFQRQPQPDRGRGHAGAGRG